MTATALGVVDVLFDARAELVALRVPRRAIDAIDRQLARVAKRPPPPANDLERFALLLLDLRDAAVAGGRTHDATALLRAAQLVTAERRALA